MKSLSILLLILGSNCLAQPTVKIDTLIDFSKKDSLSLMKELKIMNAVLNSDVFWKKIKTYDFSCTNQRTFHSGRKKKEALYPKKRRDKHLYTNQEIHDLIWFGQDEIGEIRDGVINLKLRSKKYPPNKNGTTTHGSTNKNTLIISSSPKTRINNKTTGVYACHLFHEYMHVLGFEHRSNDPKKNRKKCGGPDVALGIQLIAIETIKAIR